MNLKIIREGIGLSQKQLADKISISESYLSLIESKKRKPSVEVAKQIAECLGFEWTRFFEGDGR